MKFDSLKYSFMEALKSIKRNKTLSIASIATVTATLFILGAITLGVANVDKAITKLGSMVEVKIYLNEGISDNNKNAIENKIKAVEGINTITFQSKEDALKDLKLINNNWMDFAEKFIKIMVPYLNESQFKIAMDKMNTNSPNVMYSMWKSMIEKDYRDTLSKIKVPTLIIFGEKSTFYSIDTANYICSNICNSKLVVFENCTHLLVNENPIKFNNIIEEFIQHGIDKSYI